MAPSKNISTQPKILMALLMNMTPPLGHRVGEGADEGGEQDVGNGKEDLQQRLVLGRRLHLAQGGDGGNQQGVVGERRKKLRRHDDVKAERHVSSGLGICPWSQVIPWNRDQASWGRLSRAPSVLAVDAQKQAIFGLLPCCRVVSGARIVFE